MSRPDINRPQEAKSTSSQSPRRDLEWHHRQARRDDERRQLASSSRTKGSELPGQPSERGSGTASSSREIVPIPRAMVKDYEWMNEELRKQHVDNRVMQESHLTKSKKAIEAAVESALERVPAEQRLRKAIIYGGGHFLDIPKEKFAEAFDEITVVDIDKETLKIAINEIGDKKLKRKFKIIQADVSGVLCEYSTEMMRALETSESTEEFFNAASGIEDRMANKALNSPPNVGSDFDFVCSHLLLSQITSQGMIPIQTAAEKKFGSQVGSRAVGEYIQSDSHKNFKAALEQAHIRYLGSSASSSAIVYFADTFVATTSSPLGIQQKTELVDHNIIEPTLKELFEPIDKPKFWAFDQGPQLRFLVKSHILEVKPSEPEQSSESERSSGEEGRGRPMDEAKRDVEGLTPSHDQLTAAESKQLQGRVQGLEQQLAADKIRLQDLEQEKGQLQGRVQGLEQQLAAERRRLQDLEQENKQLQGRVQGLEQQLAADKIRLQESKQENDQLREEVDKSVEDAKKVIKEVFRNAGEKTASSLREIQRIAKRPDDGQRPT